MTRPRPWRIAQWGVALTTGRSRRPVLLGCGWLEDWADRYQRAYPGEPLRVLLFTRRAQARAWCRVQQARYASRPRGDICRAWRFRPVRVVETVRVT
jgi:hypothetical protein